MAAKRERPYLEFNFLVDLGDGKTDGPDAGFQECSPIATSVAVAEYRNGNDAENSVQKITGLNRANDVTLKRGIIESATLYNWFDAIRNGGVTQLQTVRITLQSEDHSTIVATWVLRNARPIRYVSGPLNAKGSDVALEELTLAYERLEIDDLT
ncbi:MAG TPA: phage tail protein [Solirubrobacteraceae bacterium]|nr:phage tail protein [Solirubrobacteraceae bacterium]